MPLFLRSLLGLSPSGGLLCRPSSLNPVTTPIFIHTKMDQQKLQHSEIDAHICQMIGIAEHDFCRFTLVEQQSLRDYYLEVRQAMKVSPRDESRQNEVYYQDFEAQFLGDVQYVCKY